MKAVTGEEITQNGLGGADEIVLDVDGNVLLARADAGLMHAAPVAFQDEAAARHGVAEGFGQVPKGTHDYEKFIDPDAMRGLLAHAALECIDFEGIAMSPTRGLHLSDDLKLNYLVAARHSG